MKTDKLYYDLPEELIAQEPVSVRSDSRLLVLNRTSGDISDRKFSGIGEFLRLGDCLVLNNTKVLPARFFARRATGAGLEGLFLSASGTNTWTVYLKGLRKVKTGEKFYLTDGQKQNYCEAELLEKNNRGRCSLKIKSDADSLTILEEIGFPPLPPYIKRDDNPDIARLDKERYQTVYAQKAGAVAAPTAGLHFTEELIQQLKTNGITFANVTLHVGAGTFKPITAENIEHHQIHEERFGIDAENAGIINAAKKQGRRIIAVGTTSTRVIETIAENSFLEPTSGTTELFITPGYKFKITDAMITNFHLPKSSLLALVAAFAGLEKILAAYKHAVEQQYRFYSYGDAMLII
ncbi:MAG: tRNA preQ1(34) S-adenosylmethionine ribosyltransferase-isomerase QueA [Sedimentisphaerales bacterium]|nr:tRNA preQ1(34) S-adenosylmethionine ribosyltransferase-isomerase QueA [Sedimentisphaerales bacterium]